MKFPLFLIFVAALSAACAQDPINVDQARIVIDAKGLAPALPPLFSATVEQSVQLNADAITGEMKIHLELLQGAPAVLSLGLSGEGEVTDVSGDGLRDWSVRQGLGDTAGKRFLDLRPNLDEARPPHLPENLPVPTGVGGARPLADPERSRGASALAPTAVRIATPTHLDLVVHTRLLNPPVPGRVAILLAGPGDAIGFSSQLVLLRSSTLGWRIVSSSGLSPVGDDSAASSQQHFAGTGEPRLEARLETRPAILADAAIVDAQLTGNYVPTAGGVEFRLQGTLRAQKIGVRIPLLSGRLALVARVVPNALSDADRGPASSALGTTRATSSGWHVELTGGIPGHATAYSLVCDQIGSFPLDLRFVAGVSEGEGDWRALAFTLPAGAVVSITLQGLGTDVQFKPGLAVVPVATPQGWRGFLPANGAVALAWKPARAASESALFFTSLQLADVQVGAGLLRQSTQLKLQVLQGKLASLTCALDGPGEILGVEGGDVVGWQVAPHGAGRLLTVQFSQPVLAETSLVVRSQFELGRYPARCEPLRISADGAVRQSGYLRLAANGPMRLDVTAATGLMQLSPEQYPGAPLGDNARAAYVYRFPAADFGCQIVAAEIEPEVDISLIATYQSAETEQIIAMSLELDVREAPLREWSLLVPADYSVGALIGSDLADYVAESGVADGYRQLKLVFARPLEGRTLVNLRLEKNYAVAAGPWKLAPLQFPGAKSVRGQIGVVAAAGYRVTAANVDQLTDIPLNSFAEQTAGLAQAWRLRSANWTAEVRMEALAQSIQADVFHLYSLQEGIAHASILLNYFIVGSPVREWRIAIPAEAGNIEVTGQGFQRDWRREGAQIVVSLHEPVLGAATVLLTFDEPTGAHGGVFRPAEVRPLGVQAERGNVQFVSALQMKLQTRKAEGGLLKLEPTELPLELQMLSPAPSLVAYQYSARPFDLEIDTEPYPVGETVDQAVDFAQLTSQVSADGQVATEAQYWVKTRGSKALRLTLAPGTRLWSAQVGDEAVNTRTDGGQLLVPLPAELNPNDPVRVTLRLGQAELHSPARIALSAPRLNAPTLTTQWTVRGDAGRQLVSEGGNTELLRPVLTESGFEWIGDHAEMSVLAALLLTAFGIFALWPQNSGWWRAAGCAACGAVVIGAALLAADAYLNRRPNLSTLDYAAALIPAGSNLSIEVGNEATWQAMIVGWGVAAFAAGSLLVLAGAVFASSFRATKSAVASAGAGLLAVGLLAQHGGAVPFFAAVSGVLYLAIIAPEWLRWSSRRSARKPGAHPIGGSAALSSLALLFAGVLVGGGQPIKAAPPASTLISEKSAVSAAPLSWIQTGKIRNGRLYAELDLTVRGAPGDSFLLVNAPAILTEFTGNGLRVGKADRNGKTAYYVMPEREGIVTAHARFELALPDDHRDWLLPTGPAAVQRLTLELDQGGWEFASPQAVEVIPTPGLGDHRSGATLILAPGDSPVIQLRPKRTEATGPARFFAQETNLYVPGPGLVNGYTQVTIRPVGGRLSSLEMVVPAGFIVGDVLHGPVANWQFDPRRSRLSLSFEPAQTDSFQFEIHTQRSASGLPFDLPLEPFRAAGAAGEGGTIALAFGGDAQSEGAQTTDLSAVSREDFDSRQFAGIPPVTVQQVWRYGRNGGQLNLKITAVTPEVRVVSRQLLTLDDDRTLLAAELQVEIMRAGVFQLSFPLPPGLEIETLSGPALSQWTESTDSPDGNLLPLAFQADRSALLSTASPLRIITLHLNGRTIGTENFAMTLTGPAPARQRPWAVPRISIREATRQTGEAIFVPGKGLQLRALDLNRATEIDPRSAGALQPGSLAFHLLDSDWSLRLAVDQLDPWVTVQTLQEVTYREGLAMTRIALRCRVENAAVQQLRLRLPQLDEQEVRTLRASGTAVTDLVKVPGTPDQWMLRFRRDIAGETDAQIEYQGPLPAQPDAVRVAVPEVIGARQSVNFVAIRSGAQLAVEAAQLPLGWTKADWTSVPDNLAAPGNAGVPALCFRVDHAEAALGLRLRRNALAEALKLRVTQGELATLFSPNGDFLTSVDFAVEVVEKSTLRVGLPAGARLFRAEVNGTGAPTAREGDAYLFTVTAGSDTPGHATVRLVYSGSRSNAVHGWSATSGRAGSFRVGANQISLAGPTLNVPLQNLTWRVMIPPGYDLRQSGGEFQLRERRLTAPFDLHQYQSLADFHRSTEAGNAAGLLEKAYVFLKSGDQQDAVEALSRVAADRGLDPASDEDARVQLRKLKTEQAVLGLNTRRQRLYLDNRAEAAPNDLLEQSAHLNPLIQGKVNFAPGQMDQLLMGNTMEENSALRGIAGRFVDQQLTVDPAPRTIDETIPDRGEVATFTRSLQVDGGTPLRLDLKVGKSDQTSFLLGSLLAIGIVGIAAARFRGGFPNPN